MITDNQVALVAIKEFVSLGQKPLLLSTLGTLLQRKKRIYVEGLKEIIESDSSLALVSHPDIKEKIAVCFSEEAEEVLDLLKSSKVIRSIQGSDIGLLKKFYFSVVAAFCAKKFPEQSVFLQNEEPFKFMVDNSDASPSGFIRIDDRYILDGIDTRNITLLNEEVSSKIVNNIKDWASENNIDLNKFIRPDIKHTHAMGAEKSNALSRLLASQREDVLKHLVIPADIINILLKHR